MIFPSNGAVHRYTVGTSWSEEMSNGGEISVTVDETMQVSNINPMVIDPLKISVTVERQIF